MKNKIVLVTAISMFLVIAGCKKFLDQKPLTQITADQYFQKSKDITASLAGMYAAFGEEMTGDGDGQTSMYGGKYHYWGEGRSDNFDRGGYPNNTITELSLNALTSGNAAADWTGLYKAIGRANTIIKYVPQVLKSDNSVTQVTVNNALAQAYAMRAMCYFYIVRLWGDAPIWTEPYSDITQTAERARAPKDKVMDSVIIPDIQNAYNLIQKNQTANIWYINEGAIAAIAGDVYLWKKDYANAISWYQKVFAAKGATGALYGGASGANLEPAATWKNLFMSPTASIESIWSINWDYATNGCACLPVSIQKSNTPIYIDSAIYVDWRNNKADIRMFQTMHTLGGLNHQDKLKKYYPTNTTNWTGSNANTLQQQNVYLVMNRLGDVFLSYAEALNKTGDVTNALRYLNYIRVRAGLPAYIATDPKVATMDDMEDAILDERRYELFGEGKRWFDLVRTDHVNKIMDPVLTRRQIKFGTAPTGFGSDKNRTLWPLHRDVLNSNKLLTQTPSY